MTRRSAPALPSRKRDGSRTWRTQDLLAQLEWIAEATGELPKRAETVIRRACADVDDGTSTGGDERVSGGRVADDGSENGRVPSMVLRRAKQGDPVERAMALLVFDVMTLRKAAAEAASAIEFLRGLSPEEARKLVEEKAPVRNGAGFCENPRCGRWVPGTRVDRIRRGRCDRCRKHLESHDEDWRPRDDAVPEPVSTAYLGLSPPR